jgi:hypothetical protein
MVLEWDTRTVDGLVEMWAACWAVKREHYWADCTAAAKDVHWAHSQAAYWVEVKEYMWVVNSVVRRVVHLVELSVALKADLLVE